jgi:hypothetical protein
LCVSNHQTRVDAQTDQECLKALFLGGCAFGLTSGGLLGRFPPLFFPGNRAFLELEAAICACGEFA